MKIAKDGVHTSCEGVSSMKQRLLASMAVASLAMIPPVAQAAVISIADYADNESLALFVNLFNQSTTLPNPPPGGGTSITLTPPTSSNGVSSIVYTPGFPERLSFEFANQINWSSDVYFYRYFTEPA